ncbi:hypothetical protein, partial [Levilactobacillus tujiorum]|uniref:hypothetical protein n=1 Tax=Levilactobacillus tujiorum TaxID=2912243 RepID=UPI001B3B2178
MLLPNFAGSTLASYRLVSWVFLGISWWCQLESITWWTIQPVRSLEELVIFTGLAVMLTVGTSLFKTISWSGTAAFMRDLNFIFLPELFTRNSKIPIKHMIQVLDGNFTFSPFKCRKRASA